MEVETAAEATKSAEASVYREFEQSIDLYDLLNSGLLSDITITTPGGRALKLHRAILALRSPYFRGLFCSGWHEAQEGKVEMKVEDPLDLFPHFVTYFYTGKFTVDRKAVIAAHTLADYMRIDELKEFCVGFIKEDMRPSSALHYFREALRYQQEEIKGLALGMVAHHFSDHGIPPFAAWEELLSLPLDQILALLRHPMLNVACERHVLDLVYHYCLDHRPPLSADEEGALIGEIRFAFLDSTLLANLPTIGTHGTITAEYILPHMRQRLLLFSQKKVSDTMALVFQPRESYVGQSDGIPGGITQTCIPQEGRASSQPHNGIYTSIFSEDPFVYFSTPPTWNQWVEVVYPTPFVPASYKFRSHAALRIWDFSASGDGITYTTLSSHNDTDANTDQPSTFALPCGTRTRYRYFRICGRTLRISAFHVFPASLSFWPSSDTTEESA